MPLTGPQPVTLSLIFFGYLGQQMAEMLLAVRLLGRCYSPITPAMFWS
ncbi:hypothetical protein [Mesorhizobium sp. 113-1-2]|nr:hypothetical protein [Mesorhizobium sp. 113-1-2]